MEVQILPVGALTEVKETLQSILGADVNLSLRGDPEIHLSIGIMLDNQKKGPAIQTFSFIDVHYRYFPLLT